MDHFNYRGESLFAEDLPLSEIAEAVGTPCYVYSRATLERHYRAYEKALADQPSLICFAVKANSNLAVLDVLARLGAGFDIVSGGELQRVLRAGGDPAKTIFLASEKLKTRFASRLMSVSTALTSNPKQSSSASAASRPQRAWLRQSRCE